MRMKCFFKCLSLRCRLAIRATCKQVSLSLFLCHSLTVCPLACTHPPIPIAILILLVTFWLSSLPCLRLTFLAMCFVWHANFAARIEGHVSCGFRSAPVCVCRWAGVCVTYFQAGQQLCVYVYVCVCLRAGLQVGRVPPKFMTTIVSIWRSVCFALLPLSVWLIKITL